MSDLRELYQEVIVDHSRHPRNFKVLDNANRHAEGYNPLCGDQLSLYLILENGIVKEATFQGNGCAISMASASLLTEFVQGKTEQEAENMFHHFHQLLTDDHCNDSESLGKLKVLAGVKEFPARVKCATLAWHTLHAALANKAETVKTE